MSDIAELYSSHIANLLLEKQNRQPYFVTTTFCHSERFSPRSFQDAVWYVLGRYDHLYRHLTSKLMNNFSKKSYLHPMTFDFLDIPHTRASRELNFYDPVTPHVHSIYLVHEDTLDRFETLRNDGFLVILDHPALSAVRTIDARLIQASSLTNVVSYAAKLLNNREAVRLAGDAPLFTQYPKARFERTSKGIKWDERSL